MGGSESSWEWEGEAQFGTAKTFSQGNGPSALNTRGEHNTVERAPVTMNIVWRSERGACGKGGKSLRSRVG